jgi:hypothetical protein
LKRFFHVTATRNRESIETYGLDWTRMKDALGIAGSVQPEQEDCFLCLHEGEVSWFVSMNNSGGSVDVWAVGGVEEAELVTSPKATVTCARISRPSASRSSALTSNLKPNRS